MLETVALRWVRDDQVSNGLRLSARPPADAFGRWAVPRPLPKADPIWRQSKSLIAASVLALVLAVTSCTPAQVSAFFASRGHTIDQPTAQKVSDWTNLIAYLQAVERAQTPEAHVRAAAREFGIPEDQFVRVIRCESGMNPRAVNSSSGALGLGQHLPRYYGARAAALGYGYDSWSDARANARVSAWLWSTGGPGHWVCA